VPLSVVLLCCKHTFVPFLKYSRNSGLTWSGDCLISNFGLENGCEMFVYEYSLHVLIDS